MATVSRRIAGSPAAVFAVLADGWWYASWVVGASHVRAVEAAWPAVGSRLHHASGTWPITVEDETRVELVEPGERLVMLAKGAGLGAARVELILAADGAGTRITMIEEPVGGPGRWLHSPLSEALLHRRNTETLARLAALVERPTAPRR
jgi:uncharacterized protein YndB with AHSA1/START domain